MWMIATIAGPQQKIHLGLAYSGRRDR